MPKDQIRDDSSGTRVLSQIKYLELPYKFHQSLQFSFAGREYSDPENLRFEYFLIRNERDTVDHNFGRSARLVDVRPGYYKLEVYAFNSDGLRQQQPYKIFFTVLPPWWQTWWFYLSVTIAVVLLLFFYYQYRIKKIKQREAARREKAEMETAILRLQMNPHFLFNSMNAIGGYILGKDPTKAYGYLSRFSKLMRQILEDAAKPNLPLQQELHLMEQYLKVEQMRFGDKLSFSFDIDSNIDLEHTVVPTMLFQPFLENAIKHGLANKPGGGHIKMGITKNGDTHLILVVEDNGMGRKFAEDQKQDEGHISRALSITNHRLKLLKEQTGLPTGLSIEDATSNEAFPGTRVTLKIPLLTKLH
jgi:two-component sensor histidine kinase